jgi:hypothetical protein
MATQKEKPPMALVGLTLGVGQFWKQYATAREIYPFQNHTSPPKTSGDVSFDCISNSCHTVDNADPTRKNVLVSTSLKKNLKHRENT